MDAITAFQLCDSLRIPEYLLIEFPSLVSTVVTFHTCLQGGSPRMAAGLDDVEHAT
jgi:hypothetical protein